MELAFIKAGFVPGDTELSRPEQQRLAVWQLKVLAHDMTPSLYSLHPSSLPGGDHCREN